MKLLFMGSDEISCPALKKIIDQTDHELVGVITQPDRPKGRRRKLAPCSLKAYALEKGLTVYSPEKVGSEESVAYIQSLQPDLLLVVAYGQYIPQRVISIPKHRAINLHPSLLPRYRGASPIQQTIASGDIEGGVTILYVAKEMDAGDILLQQHVTIDPVENAIELGTRLAILGAGLLLDVINQLAAGTANPQPQDEKLVVHVSKLSKEDGRINWSDSATKINHRIRGYQPWPMCYCTFPDRPDDRLQICRAEVVDGKGQPGQVLSTKGEGPVIATGHGALRLLDVKPPGKKRMSGSALVCGRYLKEFLT